MENSEKASFGSNCSIFASTKTPNVLYLEEELSCFNTLNWNEGIYDGNEIDEEKLTKTTLGDKQYPQHMKKISSEVLHDRECWSNNNIRSLEKVQLRLDDSSLYPKETFGCSSDVLKLKRSYLKNLIVLSFCFLLVFSAFFSLRNLQTSINRKDSLGLVSLACMNAAFAAGCILANSIVQKVRPKRVIAVMLIGNSLYVASNFYPIFFTLIPATLFLGFTMANLLVAQSTYLTSIAVSYASAANKRPDHIISAFNGYFLFMMYLAHFVGNLLSSAVFHVFSCANSTEIMNKRNESHFGSCSLILSSEKQNFDISIDENVIVVLLSIFMVITLQAHIIITIYLDKLDVIFYKSKLGLKNQICEIWNLHLDPKMKFMLPLMAYLGFQEAFIYADFTNSYITCSIGLHMVGYAMMTFSAMDSLSSFLCGYLRKFLAQRFMVAFGSILNVTTLLFLYYWRPSSDQSLLIFFIAAILGIVDGIWQTLTNSLCGILFSSRQRVAIFSSLRMYQAIGFTIASIYSHFLNNDIKIIIILAFLVVACFSFVGLEFQTSKIPVTSKEYLTSNDI